MPVGQVLHALHDAFDKWLGLGQVGNGLPMVLSTTFPIFSNIFAVVK